MRDLDSWHATLGKAKVLTEKHVCYCAVFQVVETIRTPVVTVGV